jgi:hypothetical protein
MRTRSRFAPGARVVGLASLSAVLLGWLAGCQSTSPTGAKVMATTTINGRDLSDIRLAALETFKKAGYAPASAFGRDLLFEKRASGMTELAYGTWMSPSLWIRVKVRIEEIKPGMDVLDCTVYRVSDRGDSVLEEENTAYGMKSKPFKELLAEIKSRLDALPPSTNTK